MDFASLPLSEKTTLALTFTPVSIVSTPDIFKTDACKNMSLLPSEGDIKPNPFRGLNHLISP